MGDYFRIESGRAMLIGGIRERYNIKSSAGIPAQWKRLIRHLANVPGRVGHIEYGVSCNSDDEGNFDYICGVEVSDFSKLPSDLEPPANRSA